MKHSRSLDISGASAKAYTGRHARVQAPSGRGAHSAPPDAASAAAPSGTQRRDGSFREPREASTKATRITRDVEQPSPAAAARMPRSPRPAGGAQQPRTPAPGTPEADPTLARRYSRSTARHYARMQKKSRRRRVVRNVLLALLACVLVAVGAVLAYTHVINSNFRAGMDDLRGVLVQTDLTREPFYMLLLGTDQSLERVEDNVSDGIYRTDSIILARIDAPNKQVTLVSIPRDTKVDLGEHGIHKINAAYAFGGARLAVETVSKLSGAGISHFALVDMDGLSEVVDTLGGIEVDVPVTIDDEMAGGFIASGLQTLDGQQALVLARSRHNFDEYGDGDEYRTANQRLVLKGIADKLLASDPATIATTVEQMSHCVQTDLAVSDIVGLAQALAGMDTSRSLYTAQMPTEDVYEDEVWFDIVLADEWNAMMDRVNRGLPPTVEGQVDPQTGTVLATAGDGAEEQAMLVAAKREPLYVRNGTTVEGLGQRVADQLEAEGFNVVDVSSADASDYTQTLVVYSESDQARHAAALASFLGGGAQAKYNDGTFVDRDDNGFTVVIGSDYAG